MNQSGRNLTEVNPIKKRMLFLSPSVASGKERECRVNDFESVSKKAIGQGAFGQVYKVRHIATGNLFAIKTIAKNKILAKGLLQQMRREVRIMYSLDHPNIVKLYNHFEDDKNFYLILELAENGALFHKLVKVRCFEERATAQYMREVALAVQYLHSREPPIIHRDIKPENIFLDSEGSAKLGDFGWSSTSEEVRSTYCGTLEYLAPEMIDRTGHDTSLDLWNLGILLFELLSGRAPFQSKNQKELFQKIKNCKIGFPKNYPMGAKDLTRRLLRPNKDERCTIEEMLNHSWMMQHEPLRTTVGTTTVKEILPASPREGAEVEFKEHEYKVISKPDQAELQLNKEKSLKAKLNTKSIRSKEELLKKKQQIAKLEEMIRQKQLESHNIQKAVADLRIQTLQCDMDSLGLANDSADDLNEKYIEAKSKLGTLQTEINLKKKERERGKTINAEASLRTLTVENFLKAYKHRLRALKWSLASIKPAHLDSVERILDNASRKKAIDWCFPVLENMNKELGIRSDLHKVVENQAEDLQEKEYILQDLTNELAQLRETARLKHDLMQSLFE